MTKVWALPSGLNQERNENGSKTLKDLLSENSGPFSKTSNVMLALELMEKGEELASNQVTKVHLINIIKVLCSHLEWAEVLEEHEETETKVTEVSNEENKENNQSNHSNTNIVIKNSEKICRFYRLGKCQYGKSGK